MVLAWPVLPAGVNEKGWVVVGILSHRLYIEGLLPPSSDPPPFSSPPSTPFSYTSN